jgi:raffinose/stachyose/melibiose transport system substrate-binding protein
MKNAWKGAGALAVVAALALTGCSNPGTTATTTTSGSVAWPAQNTKLKGTTLTIWAATNDTTIPTTVVKGFEKLTGAKIKIETIPDPYEQSVQTKIATGDKPDLAFWQPTASELTSLNATTNLQPLTGAPWISSVKPSLRNITGLLNKTRYAALVSTPALEGVYYNKQVFAKAGITSLPKNWKDFVALAATLKSKGVTPFYEMGGDKWATQWWVQVQLADAAKSGLWSKINGNTEKFTDPTILSAIKNYKDLIDDGYFNSDIKTATFVDQGNALLGGKAAMAMQVNSFFTELQASADTATLNSKIGFFPISTTGNVATFIPDQSNSLVAFKTGNAKREAASRQLLEYWMGDGYKSFISSVKTVSLETKVPNPAGVPKALLAVSAALPDSVGSMQALAVANPDLYIYLDDMIQGTKTPADVANATQQQFAQLAKAEGVKAFQ